MHELSSVRSLRQAASVFAGRASPKLFVCRPRSFARGVLGGGAARPSSRARCSAACCRVSDPRRVLHSGPLAVRDRKIDSGGAPAPSQTAETTSARRRPQPVTTSSVGRDGGGARGRAPRSREDALRRRDRLSRPTRRSSLPWTTSDPHVVPASSRLRQRRRSTDSTTFAVSTLVRRATKSQIVCCDGPPVRSGRYGTARTLALTSDRRVRTLGQLSSNATSPSMPIDTRRPLRSKSGESCTYCSPTPRVIRGSLPSRVAAPWSATNSR